MLKTISRLMFSLFVVIIPAQLMAAPFMAEHVYKDWLFSGDNHRYMFSSVIDFYETSGDGMTLGTYLASPTSAWSVFYPSQLDWGHSLPSDLSVPPGQILRAKLWIDAWKVDENNNYVRIEGLYDWDPLNHWGEDMTTYDLTHVDVPDFWNNSPLNVSLMAGEWKLRVDHAALMIDYQTAPIPEPATVALFGLGLAGLGLVRRRK